MEVSYIRSLELFNVEWKMIFEPLMETDVTHSHDLGQ